MLKWLQNLPKVTQTSYKLEESLCFFRNNIKKIEIDPYKIFNEFRTEFEINREIIGIKTQKLDVYFAEYLENLALKLYAVIKNEGLKEWVKINKTDHPDNMLLQILEESDYKVNIEKLSSGLIGVNLYDWTEITETIFFNEMDKQLKAIKQITFDPNKHMVITFGDDATIIHKNIELSTKANLITSNISRIIETQGKFITKEELDYIIFTLINKYLK